MTAVAVSIAIVGGGPAGLIAAEQLASAGYDVTILDHRPSVGRKFLLAGRSGLNLTNDADFDTLRARYGAAASRLGPALERFGPDDLRRWAGGLGVDTFVGSGGRVFPIGMKATPLLRAWLRRLLDLGVSIRPGWDWHGRPVEGFDATLLALGGASWPRVGADGSWVSALRRLGVVVHDLESANAGLIVAWSTRFVEQFHGTPLKNVAVSFGDERVRSDLMITRTGLEGTAVYSHSAAVRRALAVGPATIVVDLFPDLDEQRLVERISGGRRSDSTSNRLRRLGLSPAAASLLRESSAAPTPSDPRALAQLLKTVPISVVTTAPIERAISSSGGVDWDEIDERFMLRRVPGLFVAGEMIDWDAPTGGFLLQACFSTGVAAAAGVIDWLAGRRSDT